MSIEWLFVTSNHIYKFTDVWAKRKGGVGAARGAVPRPSLTKPVSVAKFHLFYIVNDRPLGSRPDGY